MNGYYDNKYEHSYAIDTNNQEGINYFQKALDLQCNKNDIYQKIAFLYTSKIHKDNNMANYNLNYAKQLQDKSPEWTYFIEGYILYNNNQYNQAINKFNLSLQYNNKFIESQKYLCLYYKNMLDYKNYKINYKHYLELILYIDGGYKIKVWD